jgi:PAS domain S-box-containing protein
MYLDQIKIAVISQSPSNAVVSDISQWLTSEHAIVEAITPELFVKSAKWQVVIYFVNKNTDFYFIDTLQDAAIACKISLLLVFASETLLAEFNRQQKSFFNLQIIQEPLNRELLLANIRSILSQNRIIQDNAFFCSFIVETIDDCIFIKDNNFKYLYVNSSFQKLFNKSREEIIGKTDRDIFSKELAVRFGDSDTLVLESNQPVVILMDYEDKNLEITKFVCPLQGSKSGIAGIIRDTTLINRLKNSNNEIEHLYRVIFDENPQPMWLYDEESFDFLAVNQSAINFYGYSKEEFLSMKVFAIKPEDKISEFRKITANSSVYRKNITQHVKKDQSIITTEVHSLQINYAKRKCRLVVAIDITEKILSERQIIDNQRKLRSLVSNLPGMVYRCENDRYWTMLFINERCMDITGYSASDFMNRNISYNELILPEYRESIWNKWQQILAVNGVFEEEYLIKTANNELKWVWERGHGIYDDNGNLLFLEGYIEDINESKKNEIALKESEERYRNIFYNDHTIMMLIEPYTGKIIDSSAYAHSFYGFPDKSLLDKTIFEISLDNDMDMETLFDDILNNIQKKFICHHRLANGTVRTVEIFCGKVMTNNKPHIFAIINDISDKVEAERQVKLFVKAISQSPVGIFITDPSGIISYANNRFCELSGYSLEEILGNNPRMLNSGYHDKEFYKEMWDTILSKNEWNGEVLNKKKYGDLFWGNTSISPILDEEGNISHIICIMEDLTEKKKLIEELIRAKEKAEESDRLKTAFLANVSHEIRTPMNGIIGFAELLKRPNIPPEKQIEFIAIIEKSSKRMLNIINDIVDMAKIDAGIVSVSEVKFNINNMLRELNSFFITEAENKNLSFECIYDLPDEAAIIESDETKIQQILTNLIKNSIKFTSEGNIQAGYKIEDDNIHFFVKDTGIGIPEEYHEIIFDRFRQIDTASSRSYEGAGLGLAICKAYTELLGGKIWVESSTMARGATFHVVLHFHPVKENMEKKINIPAIAKPITILIVEDDEKSSQFLAEVFSKDPVHTLFAANGNEAVEIVKNHHVDIILMDLKMPELDGFEATRIIRQIYPQTPIIAQTAYSFSDERMRALQAGCNDYISKPIVINKLYELINKYIRN